MDERKNRIKDLEAKKATELKARNQLLEGLGDALFQRIGTEDPFTDNAADAPGGLLAEYRRLQKEITVAEENIVSLEKDNLKLKELEESITAKEGEKSLLEEELLSAYTIIGKSLLEDPDTGDTSEFIKQQEENLLTRIDGQETKLEELERREGGIIKWLGKNAQMTLSKARLSKDRSTLKRLYRDAGERFVSDKPAELLSEDLSEEGKKPFELKKLLTSLSEELSGLKVERRRIKELFGPTGSSTWRVNGLEKNIANVKKKFPSVNLRMGLLAADNRQLFSSYLNEKDEPVLERAGLYKTQAAQYDLDIEKIRTSMSIDKENDEIEKMKKAITNQRQKIATAEETIAGIEKQIAESEKLIAEWKAFVQEDNGG